MPRIRRRPYPPVRDLSDAKSSGPSAGAASRLLREARPAAEKGPARRVADAVFSTSS